MMLRGLGFTIPISCPTGQNPSPIKAWQCPASVTNQYGGTTVTGDYCMDNDPVYNSPSNWTCVTPQAQALAGGFTYTAGLKLWTDPTSLITNFPTAIIGFPTAPQFALGALTPILGVLALYYVSKGGR